MIFYIKRGRGKESERNYEINGVMEILRRKGRNEWIQ